jgi:hypothetical protein
VGQFAVQAHPARGVQVGIDGVADERVGELVPLGRDVGLD